MTFRDVIGRDAESVPWHEHDAADISGEGVFTDLTVDRLLGGTISGKTIIISGGTSGILKSSNYSAGSAGWQILGDGSAEFNDVTVRGAIIAGSGSSIGFDDVTAATNTAALVIGGSGTIRSSNYSAGSAGWSIEGDGDAEFNDVTVRGDLISGTAPDQVTIQSGVFTATDGSDSITIDPVSGYTGGATIRFVNGSGHEGAISIGGSGAFGVTAEDGILSLTGDQVLVTAPGTAAAPGLSLDAAGVTTGFYYQSSPAALLGFTIGGTAQAHLVSGAFRMVDGSAGTPAYSFIGDTDTGMYRPSADRVDITLGGTSELIISNAADAGVRSIGIRDTTTGSAGNVFISATTGLLARSTSSRRYKRVIRPYFRSNGTTVLNLEPSTFYSKAAADNHTRRYLGLIAEDVAEHFPLAAIHDDEGRPDAVDWNAVTAALLAEVRSLRARVDALEAAA